MCIIYIWIKKWSCYKINWIINISNNQYIRLYIFIHIIFNDKKMTPPPQNEKLHIDG
jgi:hypothetical protein